MTISFKDETVETDGFKLFKDDSGTVILEDKTNDNQVELDDDVTMADVASHLASDTNPHTTTLEQVRAENNQLFGPVNAAGNDLTNIGAASAEDVVTEDTPFADVRAFGAVGDGVTDDTQAVQDAADAASQHGVLYVPKDFVCRITSTVDIDLGLSDSGIDTEELDEQTRFRLLCDGAFKFDNPDPGIHLHNGLGPQVFIRMEGGGDPSNPVAQRGLRVSSMMGGYYNGVAHEYEGEVFSFDPGSANNISMQSVGRLLAFSCGRSIDTGTSSGWGEIGDIWDKDPAEGPIFRAADLSLNQYENVADRTNSPVTFSGPHQWIDKVAVGGSTTADLMKLDGANESRFNTILAYAGNGNGLVIDSSSAIYFNLITELIEDAGLVIDETGSNATELVRGTVYADRCQGPGIRVTDNILGDHIHLEGNVVSCARDGGAGIEIDSTNPRIYLDNLQSYCAAQSVDFDASFPANNDIRGRAVDLGRGSGVDGELNVDNGEGVESANAEQPQESYPTGTLVRFTDTGDGSGTGTYLIGRDGSTVKLTGNS
jgi:hypothetical protein